MRYLTIACFVLGGGMLVAAAVLYLRGEDGPGALIDEPERELTIAAEQDVPLAFVLRNPTRHEIEVVGLAPC